MVVMTNFYFQKTCKLDFKTRCKEKPDRFKQSVILFIDSSTA